MTFDLDDVIAALASAPGPGQRAIIRISGAAARDAVLPVFRAVDERAWRSARCATRFPGLLTLGDTFLRLPCSAYLWPTRRSYTGQPLIELHLPGSPPLVESALAELYRSDIRPARAGEFTLRAFLAGRLDLVQAEAVLGVIDAEDHHELDLALRQLAGGISGRLAHVHADLLSLLADLEAGLDFVEEDIEFVGREQLVSRLATARIVIEELLTDAMERWRNGDRARVVLAGLPNAGKSTLFNALVGDDRALVSPVAGTTRDWLTTELNFEGLPVELIDTAGWERSADDLSAAMQSLRAEQLERADLILWCVAADSSFESAQHDEQIGSAAGSIHERTILVRTKVDLGGGGPVPTGRKEFAHVSAVTGVGLDELRDRISRELVRERRGTRQVLGSTAARGRKSLATARDALSRALAPAGCGIGEELVAAELRASLAGLADVLGAVYTDDVLDIIFSRFCIGK